MCPRERAQLGEGPSDLEVFLDEVARRILEEGKEEEGGEGEGESVRVLRTEVVPWDGLGKVEAG